MIYTKKPKTEFFTKQWGGGSTTQLFIFPPEASYKSLNFDFRLSTATVEVETSDFTSLPGVSRTLMVLEGQMRLTHQDHHESNLSKFDVDQFEGDWKTNSKGVCKDFNLMTRNGIKGTVEGLTLNIDKPKEMSANNKLYLWVFKGQVMVTSNNKMEILNQGDLLEIRNKEESTIGLLGLSNSEIVIVNLH